MLIMPRSQRITPFLMLIVVLSLTVALLREKKQAIDGLITHRFPLAQWREGVETGEARLQDCLLTTPGVTRSGEQPCGTEMRSQRLAELTLRQD